MYPFIDQEVPEGSHVVSSVKSPRPHLQAQLLSHAANRFSRGNPWFSGSVSPDCLAPHVSTLSRMDQEVVVLRAHDDHGGLAILGNCLHPPLSNPVELLARCLPCLVPFQIHRTIQIASLIAVLG